jgi:hypothetical protein
MIRSTCGYVLNDVTRVSPHQRLEVAVRVVDHRRRARWLSPPRHLSRDGHEVIIVERDDRSPAGVPG